MLYTEVIPLSISGRKFYVRYNQATNPLSNEMICVRNHRRIQGKTGRRLDAITHHRVLDGYCGEVAIHSTTRLIREEHTGSPTRLIREENTGRPTQLVREEYTGSAKAAIWERHSKLGASHLWTFKDWHLWATSCHHHSINMSLRTVSATKQWSNQQGMSFSIDYDDFRDVFFGY